MPQVILDIITAQGWSIRYLAELTGLSYSGLRDYLHGHPNRLSESRIQRIYEVLNLHPASGLLKQETVYLWRVELGQTQLAALNRVLRVMLEIDPYADSLCDEEKPENRYKFATLPFVGGGIDVLPAPYCAMFWRGVYILIQWQLPSRPIRKASTFQATNKSNNSTPNIQPDLMEVGCAVWAEKMEVSAKRLCGISLTPSQQTLLKTASTSSESLNIETFVRWMSVAPIEDADWGSAQRNNPQWTWERVLEEIKLRHHSPEQAAKALKLR